MVNPLKTALIVGIVALATGCGRELVDPTIDATLPGHGRAGSTIDVVGERFSGEQRSVAFGGQPAEVVIWQDRRARVLVPKLVSGNVIVVVTIDGRRSNAQPFFVDR